MENTGGIIMVDNLARKLDISPKSEIEVSEAPIKWCSVSLSEVVERGKRLEASVFDVEAKQAYEVISHCLYKTRDLISNSGFVIKAHYGNRLKRKYVPKTDESTIGFIGSSEMLDIYPQPIKFMADNDTVSNLRVARNTVLISRSGTIGNVTLVNKTLEKFLISEHAIRLVCRENPGYVYCFLKSKLGQKLIQSKTYGAVVSQIEPEHIADIPVPDAPEQIKARINSLIMRSYELRDESNELIDQAQALLIQELKLPPISDIQTDTLDDNTDVQTFNVKLSDMAGRTDASYHIPIVDKIIELLKLNSAELTTVGDKRVSNTVILAGVFKRTYVKKEYGYPFLGGKEITQLNPQTEKFLSKQIHKVRYEKELKVTENTVLVTDRGTIGTVALVPKHWNGYAVSQNVLKLIPSSDEIAGYIYVFLSSEYGRILIRRQTYGSVVDMIDNHSLEMVEFPILKNQKVQKQINDLALQANKKRYEAYLLEQEALKILDDEVIYAK